MRNGIRMLTCVVALSAVGCSDNGISAPSRLQQMAHSTDWQTFPTLSKQPQLRPLTLEVLDRQIDKLLLRRATDPNFYRTKTLYGKVFRAPSDRLSRLQLMKERLVGRLAPQHRVSADFYDDSVSAEGMFEESYVNVVATDLIGPGENGDGWFQVLVDWNNSYQGVLWIENITFSGQGIAHWDVVGGHDHLLDSGFLMDDPNEIAAEAYEWTEDIDNASHYHCTDTLYSWNVDAEWSIYGLFPRHKQGGDNLDDMGCSEV